MEQIDGGDAPVILDVRSKKEFDEGHVPGAIHLPFWQVGREWQSVAPARELPLIVVLRTRAARVHCGRGVEAARIHQHRSTSRVI